MFKQLLSRARRLPGASVASVPAAAAAAASSSSSSSSVCLVGRSRWQRCAALLSPGTAPLRHSLRYCSSSSNNKSSTSPPPPPAVSVVADADGLTPEERAARDALIGHLQGLSPADRALFLDALDNPESEQRARSQMGGAGIGPRGGDMMAAFTCGVCDYRMVKRFSKHAYTKGIVIIECPSCRAKHLIADNLGWIEDDPRTVEDFLREKGEAFTRIGHDGGDSSVDYVFTPPPEGEGKPGDDSKAL